MHRPINIKSPNNTSKWQMGFNLAFKGLRASGFTLECGGSSVVGRGLARPRPTTYMFSLAGSIFFSHLWIY
jgi:hypothetical protein